MGFEDLNTMGNDVYILTFTKVIDYVLHHLDDDDDDHDDDDAADESLGFKFHAQCS